MGLNSGEKHNTTRTQQLSQNSTFYQFSIEMILLCPVKSLRVSAAEQFLFISSQLLLPHETPLPEAHQDSSKSINLIKVYIYIYIFFKFNWRVHEIKCIFSARNSWKISFIRHLVSWQNTTVLVNYYPLWLIHFVPLHLPWGPPWSFWLSWVPDVKATRNFCHLCWLRYFFSSRKFFTFSCWKFVSRCFCCPSRSTCGAA